MADEFGGVNRIIGWGLVKGGTTLATGTEEEMHEFQKKLGGEVRKVAITKAPTAAELLARDQEKTASERLTRGQDETKEEQRARRERNRITINRTLKQIPRFIRGGSDD